MSVRDMKGDPRVWEKLSWADMSGEEKELWGILGWRQDRWDDNDAPESADKAWRDLTSQEQSAAMRLGFTEGVWDGFEDE
ncbi:MAG TPA: hypothetical protein PLR60_11240 [Syntrophorhabdaceae bacterium]|nr:hypothetical protein [Syntrophorhabdaceae bacterium]